MLDFTLSSYLLFIQAIKNKNYYFLPFFEYVNNTENRTSRKALCILRHDVDRKPNNSLLTARIENDFGIRGSYYFRSVPESFDETIIRQISKLGHEVGYHYEDVDLIVQKKEIRINSENDKEKLIDAAYESFCRNLEKMRQVSDIKTICMHGSPRGKYDNKIIWTKYSYKELGLIGEPYYEIDFNEFAYFTDTGRRWNGGKSSIRDKVDSKFKYNFKATNDIIENVDNLPNKLMFTIHPQRWNENPLFWIQELILQNIKNQVKKYFYLRNKN